MRCSWCGGEILPDMVFSYETMKKPIYPECAKILSEALEGKEFCCGHCLLNYILSIFPEEPTNKAG